MARSVTPFLMFEGRAEEAMTFYADLFADGRIIDIRRYGADGPGPEGTVMVASFSVAGQTVMCSDSYVEHAFTFTPSISMFVTCERDEEIETLASALSKEGKVLMPPDNYGFSKRFAWVQDRFGVSWQLNLE